MRKLMNTLFVTLPMAYLALDGENVVVLEDNTKKMRVPLHNLEQIITFGYLGASPALMATCTNQGIDICFMNEHGRFLAKVTGKTKGNVLLRTAQYRKFDDPDFSCELAKVLIASKVANSRWVLERTCRDYPLRVNVEALKAKSNALKSHLELVRESENLDQLRGYEGVCAAEYYSAFNHMILTRREEFVFQGRTRRPPLDKVNALLSFMYSMLRVDVTSGLEAVGLDPYVGFMHSMRPGRESLALDIMEQLRAPIADRFVLTIINKGIVQPDDFIVEENGAVRLTDTGRKNVLGAWHNKKQETITHPFLCEKIPWGLVPYVQALLLARYLRGDLDNYAAFLWK